MESKQILINLIKEWVKTDNEIRKLKQEVNKRNELQKKNSKELMNIMSSNGIDEFDINDGKIMYSKRSVKKPINKKNLLNLLSTFYKGDSDKANELNNFIMENREEVVKEVIVRKIKSDQGK